MSLNLIIGGDIVPTPSNYALFEDANVVELVGEEILQRLRDADFSIFNLEVPLTDICAPIPKCGPNLVAPAATINGLKGINPHFFTLANNHIMDQGIDGLNSTISLLDENGIAYAGVGPNIKEASQPFVYQKNGLKIGIYCCAEHEFSIAAKQQVGANPFDPLFSLDHISNLKEECDYVIVLYHGGKEHYRYPSPYLQKVCRRIVDKGADLVICQHSHCVGCQEEWKGKTIVYGQGNFLFDDTDNEYWNSSLLINLLFNEAKGFEISYIPICKRQNKVRIAGEEGDTILKDFYHRSESIKDERFIIEQYDRFSSRMIEGYLSAIAGSTPRGLLYRILNKLTGYRLGHYYLSHKYNTSSKLRLRNIVECEAHQELFLHGLKVTKNGFKK